MSAKWEAIPSARLTPGAPVPERASPTLRSGRVSLRRALSKLGCCSRTTADALIAAGRVAINSRVERDPDRRLDLESDSIEVDGRAVAAATRVYLMLNKPAVRSAPRPTSGVARPSIPACPRPACRGRTRSSRDRRSRAVCLGQIVAEGGPRHVAAEGGHPADGRLALRIIASDAVAAAAAVAPAVASGQGRRVVLGLRRSGPDAGEKNQKHSDHE